MAENQSLARSDDGRNEGRDKNFMDIDRMVNEGLGSGQVSSQNGLIEETTTDTMTAESTADNRYT